MENLLTMKYFIFISCFIVLMSCNNSTKPEKPKNLITEDKMADILYDVFILNSAKGAAKSVLESKGLNPETYVFDKYGIDSLQFALSNNYYSYDIKTYENIITKVDTMISIDKRKYQARIDAELEQKERERDSLKRLSDSLSGKNRILKN